MSIDSNLKTSPRFVLLSPHQELVNDEIVKTAKAIARDILETIRTSIAYNWEAQDYRICEDFVATHINPKQEALTQMDERQRTLFQRTLSEVNSLMTISCLGNSPEDQELVKKLKEGIAFLPVLDLISRFDAEDSSIVDDINIGIL